MAYVVHFALFAVVFITVYLFEIIGPMRPNEGLHAALMMVLLPGLALASPLQKRPAVRRHATAYSLAAFSLANLIIGGLFAREAARDGTFWRKELLATPHRVQESFVSQLPPAALEGDSSLFRLTASGERILPNVPAPSIALPDDLDAETAGHVRGGAHLALQFVRWLVPDDKRYESVRGTFEESLRREVGEKADRYVRCGRGRVIGIVMLGVGAAALVAAGVVFYRARRADAAEAGRDQGAFE